MGLYRRSPLRHADDLLGVGGGRDHRFRPAARALSALYRARLSIGALTQEAARLVGLPPGVLVVAGTNDSIASCIGGGAIEKGRSVILGGTSGGFVLCWDPTPGVWAPPPDTYPEPPGLRYLGATISSSGLVIDWLASLCGRRDYDGWLEHASGVALGAEA